MNKMIQKILMVTFIFLSFGMITNLANAEKKFPRGCEETGFEFKDGKLLITPEEDKQTVYLMSNTSRSNIEVRYYDPKYPNLGNWESIIKPRRWSSFAADMSTLFTCLSMKKGKKTETVDCKDVMRLCQYPRAKVPLHMHGTYFITKNIYTMNSAVRQTIREGVLLRW